MTIYALYKGDKFIDVGTAEEISERQGMASNTVRYLAHSNRVKLAEEKNRKSLIAVVVEQIRKVPTNELAKKEYRKQYYRKNNMRSGCD